MSDEPSTAVGIQWDKYVDEQWLSGVNEEVLEPALPIVDPHHHLWQWLGYMAPELLNDLATHNVRATVFLETGAWYRKDGPEHLRPVGETEFVASIAQQFAGKRNQPALCQGIIGHADLIMGEAVEEVLQAHIAAGKGHFRGIRSNAQFDAAVNWMPAQPPPHLLAEKQFRAGFARLAANGLVCDAMQFQTQLPDLTDLARTFPDTTIIVNHCGGPLGVGPYANQRQEMFAQWKAAMLDVAKCPNVHVKLGGLANPFFSGLSFRGRPAAPSSHELADALRPYIETCIQAFGPGRCMFESNFPADKESCSYPILWNAFKRIASGYSDDEKQALFSDTAARVYRLTLE
ncbi:MAG TPA: amidohydrolase family protein [Candidatus Binataceae bacterium]|jgi:predicted TIM-barrel fold metal-dependent hydrolase|nr:amidohydrolase family protein [Candidatus Binataceae bacterium]